MGIKVVGVPKTMDNDLSSTDFTFGFDSAVNVAMECIDRVKTTGMSHERVIVVEVMGRDAGWVAAYAGIASVPTSSSCLRSRSTSPTSARRSPRGGRRGTGSLSWSSRRARRPRARR